MPQNLKPKKLPKGKVTIEVEPGWQEDEQPITQPAPDDGPGQSYPRMKPESLRKARKLQRA